MRNAYAEEYKKFLVFLCTFDGVDLTSRIHMQYGQPQMPPAAAKHSTCGEVEMHFNYTLFGGMTCMQNMRDRHCTAFVVDIHKYTIYI